ncbi:MAG: hypothetical protein ABIO83_02870 [Ilumatobacteraceae bacterium]
MTGTGRHGPHEDPFAILGLRPDADPTDIAAARRRLARSMHPDVGGTDAAMQRINAAAADAVALVTARTGRPADRRNPGRHDTGRHDTGRHDTAPSHGSRHDAAPSRGSRHDHPSFTVEALPVEAFEGLLIVASWLGDVIDDDPPYVLDVALTEPLRGWCRLTVVPDAGASTVGLDVAGEPGRGSPAIDAVRDAFVDGLNRLDWDDLDRSSPNPLPPC